MNAKMDTVAPVALRAVGAGPDPQLVASAAASSAGVATWSPEELEPWLLNVDASLRVHARHQLFGWTQGSLQTLVRHDVLVCGVRSGSDASYETDCFASPWLDSSSLADAFRKDAALIAQLGAKWLNSDCRPIALSASVVGEPDRGRFTAELRRAGATHAILHAMLDASGKPGSVFLFAAGPDDVEPRSLRLVELIVPYLQAAWMRTLARLMSDRAATVEAPDRLTRREREILRWVHIGKSNYEIGTILGISPLTVKNHVQHILRKLNVHNRTHAIGRALALHLLDT